MRIAVSDFDGTLFVGRRVSERNLAAIRAWREAGNRFGIATGRDLVMISYEIERWGIPFDFLVCVNGGAVYDADLSIMTGRALEDAVIPALLRHPAGQASLHVQLMGDAGLRLCLRADEASYPSLYIPHIRVDFDQALTVRDLRQVGFAYATAGECSVWTDRINRDFGDRIAAHQNGVYIDITPKNIDKAGGIAELLEHKRWREDDLLVIGDSENDLPMIRRYNGDCVAGAVECVKRAARSIYEDVAEMLLQPD